MIDNVYDALIARIDGHIERLQALEVGLEEDLAVAQRQLAPPDDESDDDDEEVEGVVQTLSQMALPHVRFNENVYDINRTLENREDVSSPMSEGTVRQNYTPFTRSDLWRSDYDYEPDSDDDTIVDEWIDPAQSPTYEGTIQGRCLYEDFSD